AQVVDDLAVWTRGMLLTYNTHGMAQRPLRSYSYKNQSIMAVAHRLLRDVPADGEAVLSRRERAGPKAYRFWKGPTALDPATDLLTFLKPHHRPAAAARGGDAAGAVEPAPRWVDELQGAEPALHSAWKVN